MEAPQGTFPQPLALTDPPTVEAELLYSMTLRTKGGTLFNFESLTMGEIVNRLAAAKPYGIAMVIITEMPDDPPSSG